MDKTTNNKLRDIIKKGESDTIEFKTSFDKTAVETITAFSNTKGGFCI